MCNLRHRPDEYEARKKDRRCLPGPHPLRKLFVSTACKVGVGPHATKLLVNHVPPSTGDLTILLQRREDTGPLFGWDEEDDPEDRFSLRSGLRTKGVKIADLDRDGASEIISVARGFPGVEGATVYIYVPDFVADEVPSAARDIIALDDDARDLGVIDIEGDGNLELVVVNTGETNALMLYSGSAASKLRSFAVESTPLAVAVGDVNGDGQDDVAVVTENSLELFQAR